jgi:acyl-CoA synthetase (NDP forming)
MPAFASARNPIDTSAAIAGSPPETYGRILHALLEDDLVDGVVAITWAGDDAAAESLVESYKSSSKPIAPVITSGGELITRQGVPVFSDPTRAVEALAAVARFSSRRRDLPSSVPANADHARQARGLLANAAGRPFVLESTAKEVLAAYGVPVAREFVCSNEDAAAKAATDLGGPVAMKVLSYGLPHKSDTGGLRLNVVGEGDVRAWYGELLTAVTRAHPGLVIEGILVQEMVPAGLELLLGMQRDALFGPMVSVGLGGVYVEQLASVELLRAPFDVDQALEALERVSGGRLGWGGRGMSPRQMETLAGAAVALGTLALDLPEVETVDVNPVIVSREDVRAVDALMVVKPTA